MNETARTLAGMLLRDVLFRGLSRLMALIAAIGASDRGARVVEIV